MSTDSAVVGGESEPNAVEELRVAAEALEAAEKSVREFGEDELERLAETHKKFTALLNRYEEPATGDGDFQTFIEFQGQIENFVDRLSDDLLLQETFEECDDLLQQRRLTEEDFEQVRKNLEPVADLVGRLDTRRDARERYRSARNGVDARLHTVRERITDLRRIRRLGDADLEAPTDQLQDPIEIYNVAVIEAFESYRQNVPARDVLNLVTDAQRFPVVNVAAPPKELVDYITSSDAGTEPIPTLLEYAEYSRSKLDHYVANPAELKTAVRPHTTYIRRLDADPLTVDWPPPEADRLVFHCRETERIVVRFAPDVVGSLRSVRRLPKTTDYQRLREAAVARSELDQSQRDRLTSGDVAAELDALSTECNHLEAALESFPEP